MGAGEGAKNMTREKRLEIYKTMLQLAEKDLEYCKITNFSLYGFCGLAKDAGSNINELDELKKYRPEGMNDDFFWFDIDPFGVGATKRINILKEIINTMTNEKTKINQNS